MCLHHPCGRSTICRERLVPLGIIYNNNNNRLQHNPPLATHRTSESLIVPTGFFFCVGRGLLRGVPNIKISSKSCNLGLHGPARPGNVCCLHTEKYFWNLIKSNPNQIVFTIFRLIWTKWTSVWFQMIFQIQSDFGLI